MSASRSLSFPAAARTGISARTILLGAGPDLCLAAYCATGAYYVAAGSAHMMLNPNENTYPESLSVYTAVQGARLNRIYLPLYSPPYALQQYGPLFYIVNFGVARASHLDLELTRLSAALAGLLLLILSGLLAFLIVRRLGFPAWLAGFSGLMLLGQHYFIEWDTTVRPDMLCLLLMLLCLYVAVGEDAPSLGACLLSGFVGGLAFLAKQPGLAAPAAVAAMLLYRKSFRRAAWFTLAAAVPVAAVLGLLIYRHESFLEQFTSLGKGYWSLRQGALFAAAKIFDVRVLLPMGIGALGSVRAWRSGKNAPATVVLRCAELRHWLLGLAATRRRRQLLPARPRRLRATACPSQWRPCASGRRKISAAGCSYRWPACCCGPPGRRALSSAASSLCILRRRTIATPRSRLTGFSPTGAHFHRAWPRAGHARSFYHARFGSRRPLELSADRGESPPRRLRSDRPGLRSHDHEGLATSAASPTSSRPVVEAMNTNYEVLCSTFSERVLVPRSRTVSISPEMLQPVFGQRCGTNMRGNAPGVLFPADLR